MAPPLKLQSRRVAAGLTLGLGLAGCLVAAAPARAVSAIPTLYGTGVSASGQTITKPTGSTPGTDANWQIIQYPSNAGSPPTAALLPTNTPNPWIGSVSGQADDNNGSTIDGVTYRWISSSPSADARSITVPGNNVTPPPPSPYGGLGDFTYILQQTFNVTNPGPYQLSLNLISDNKASFYINGSIVGGNTTKPSIAGGTLIGSSDTGAGNLGKNYTIANWATLNAGVNTAYIVVEDLGQFTGVLSSNVSFSQDVPGPLPLLGAGAAFNWSRRLRRRLQAGSTLTAVKTS